MNKTAGLMEHLMETECDICFVQETFLRVGDDAKFAEIREYGWNVMSNPRKHRSGGGIAMLYKCNFKLSNNERVTKYKSFQVMETLLATEEDIIRLINVYRPPYSKKARHTQCHFLEEFEDYLSNLQGKQGTPIIAGDFNFHLEKPDELYPRKLLELLQQFDLQQIVPLVPTHDQGGTLDLVITTRAFRDKVGAFEIIESGTNSDHYLVLFDVELKIIPSKTETKFTSYRDFNEIDVERFRSEIQDSVLSSIDPSTSLDEAVHLYNTTLSQLLDRHAPVIKKRLKKKPEPWIDEELRNLRKKRRTAERDFRSDKSNQTNRQKWLRLKNEFNSLAAIKQCAYTKKSLRSSSGDMKTLYKKVNRLLGTPSPDLPEHKDPSTLAEDFKEFFHEKINNIRQKINEEAEDTRPEDGVEESVGEQCRSSFTRFSALSEEELKSLVLKMSNKFCCLDPIPTFLLKKCVNELLPVLMLIVNKSYESGFFPKDFKCAVIKPTLKKNDSDKDILKEYRPVSNLSAVSKLLERGALNQMNDYFNDNDLHCPVQSGYRPWHSCETLLIRMFDDINKEVAGDQAVFVVLLDLSAAFDTIDHEILLRRLLVDFGISGVALQWMKSYLEGRSYCVKVGDTLSSVIGLLFGVPQGSLLGPILFILYIKALQKIAQKYGLLIQLYADDSQLYISFKPDSSLNLSDIKERISCCLNEIKRWMIDNVMKLNEDKTQLLIIGKSHVLQTLEGCDLSIKFGDSAINQTICKGDQGKSLGVLLDETLSMDRQLAEVKRKCSWTMMNLRTISRYLDESLKIMLVKQLVISKLDYCNALYMNLAKKRIKKLTTVLNMAVRFIYNITDRKIDLIPYYKKAHILPIEMRILYKVCLVCYKVFHGSSPSYINELVEIDNSCSRTRSRAVGDSGATDNFRFKLKKMTRTKIEDRRFSNYAPMTWNELPLRLRSMDNVTCFKKNLKNYYYDKI